MDTSQISPYPKYTILRMVNRGRPHAYDHSVALASSSNILFIGVPPGVVASFDKVIRDDLQKLGHSFFVWVLVSAFVVAIGVALEGPELLHEMWPRLFTCITRGSVPSLRKFKRIVRKVGFWGWLLVVIGVAGEGIFEALQNRVEGQLQTFNEILLADAQRSAGSAKDSAEAASSAAFRANDESDKATASASGALSLASSARREADSFEQDIVSAKTHAAEAESHLADALQKAADAQAELNRLKTPRSLINALALTSILQTYKGTEYTFIGVFQDQESIELLGQINKVLEAAGWKRVKPPSQNAVADIQITFSKNFSVPVTTRSGVLVGVQSSEKVEVMQTLPASTYPQYIRAAMLLKGELGLGINPSQNDLISPLEVDPGNSTSVFIIVGKKP